jgi:chromosome segregation ATPase
MMCEVLPASIPGFRPEEIQAPVGDGQAEASPRDAPKPEAEGVKYEVLFTDYYRQMTVLRDQIATLTADNAALDDAEAKAQQRIAELKKEIAEVTAELARATATRDAVLAHRNAVAAKLAEVQAAIDGTRESNRIAAAEIAVIQLEATKRIDERTRRMVQAGAGGN